MGAAAEAPAYGPGGQSRGRALPIARRRCAATRSVTSETLARGGGPANHERRRAADDAQIDAGVAEVQAHERAHGRDERARGAANQTRRRHAQLAVGGFHQPALSPSGEHERRRDARIHEPPHERESGLVLPLARRCGLVGHDDDRCRGCRAKVVGGVDDRVEAFDGTGLPDIERLAGGDAAGVVNQANGSHAAPLGEPVGDGRTEGARSEYRDGRHDGIFYGVTAAHAGQFSRSAMVPWS